MKLWGQFTKFGRETAGFTSLQLALGFAAVGLASLIAVPFLNSGSTDRVAAFEALKGLPGIDSTTTASVKKGEKTPSVRYTVRRSVLQKDPKTPCVIFSDGRQQGGC